MVRFEDRIGVVGQKRVCLSVYISLSKGWRFTQWLHSFPKSNQYSNPGELCKSKTVHHFSVNSAVVFRQFHQSKLICEQTSECIERFRLLFCLWRCRQEGKRVLPHLKSITDGSLRFNRDAADKFDFLALRSTSWNKKENSCPTLFLNNTRRQHNSGAPTNQSGTCKCWNESAREPS